MLNDGAKLSHSVELTADAVVIGTGAGGAAAGRALAEQGISVIFLEEGGVHPPSSHRDAAFSALRRLYRNQGLVMAMGAPSFPVPLGCAFGGTTVINSGTCFRTPEEIHQSWVSNKSLGEISYESLLPHYLRIEKDLGVAPASDAVMSKTNLMTRDMLAKEGISGRPLQRNAPGCAGCGMCCYGCTSGAKKSMDVSLLPKAMDFGAKAFVHCRAERLLKSGIRIVGVDAAFLDTNGRPTGHRLQVRARVVLAAAGTIHTPAFLRRNGIRHPELGRNLTVHPASKIYAEFEQDVSGWNGIPQAWAADALHEDGVLFEGVFLPPDVVAPMVPFGPTKLHEFMRKYRNVVTYGFMIEDSTTGRVLDLPLIGSLVGPLISYHLTERDAARIHKATALLARVFLKNGARRVVPLVHSELTELRSLQDLEKFESLKPQPKDVEVAAFHPLGTARIGATAESGVVDSDGGVYGRQGLYVCDGSIMPTALGVNPQLTIMALADRIGSRLATRLSGSVQS